jgi:Histidine phosphatase superfamily (branch 1)
VRGLLESALNFSADSLRKANKQSRSINIIYSRNIKVSDPQKYVEKVFAAGLNPGEKKVMFIRHAISVGNTLNLIYGLSDYPLTDQGQAQANALEPIFSGHKHRFEEFVCSGLQRTRQTGGLVLGLGLNPTEQQIRTELNFNEYNFGPLEGVYSGKMDYFEHEIFFQL